VRDKSGCSTCEVVRRGAHGGLVGARAKVAAPTCDCSKNNVTNVRQIFLAKWDIVCRGNSSIVSILAHAHRGNAPPHPTPPRPFNCLHKVPTGQTERRVERVLCCPSTSTTLRLGEVRERHALDKRLLVFVGHNVPLHLDPGANVKPRRPMVSHTHCTAVRGCKHESLGERHPNTACQRNPAVLNRH